MLGVVEGFFGPEWPWADRQSFCKALKSRGGDFYIYAPKRDPYLRKTWTEDHPIEWWSELGNLSQICQTANVDFGVALSPFELHNHWTPSMREVLKRKVLALENLGVRYLGLFFDDMKGAPDLAAKQSEIVEFTRTITSSKIIFCPTYYSYDPILDKVFGTRPVGYLEELGRSLHKNVEICWTGSKVVSSEIPAAELRELASILRRKPFIWDNLYANDGPKMCKFLKLKEFAGRPAEALAESSGWALNLMNQPSWSEILFANAALVLKKGLLSGDALRQSLEENLGQESARKIKPFLADLNEVGLDRLSDKAKSGLAESLLPESPCGIELHRWLAGEYIVGPECLTD